MIGTSTPAFQQKQASRSVHATVCHYTLYNGMFILDVNFDVLRFNMHNLLTTSYFFNISGYEYVGFSV